MKRHSLSTALIIASLIVVTPMGNTAKADAIVTLSGRRVEGKIVNEDPDSIFIDTKYGQLRFYKRNLSQIERGAGGAGLASNPAPPPPGGDPFGGAAVAPAAAPFGDPFGSAPVAPPPPAGGDPFSAAPSVPVGDPFGSAPAPAATGGDPFAAAAAPAGGDPFSAAPAPAGGDPFGSAPAPAGDPFGAAPAAAPASPRAAFAGFGIPIDQPGSAAPAAPAGGDPFGGAPAGGDPFGAAPAPAGGGPFGGPPPPNPFGGGDPFGAAPAPAPGGGDPFSFGAAPAAEPVAMAAPAAAARSEAAREQTKFVPPARKDPPQVKMGNSAVAYGIYPETPIDLRASEKSRWDSVSEDTQLREGAEIRTSSTRTARLMLRDKKDEIRISEQTQFAIEKLSDNTDELTLFLHRGSVWADLQARSNPNSIQIRTPELTASIHGTRFGVDRIQGGTRVIALSGDLNIKASLTGSFATVAEGQSAIVNASGQILGVEPTDSSLAQAWEGWDQLTAAPASDLTAKLAAANTQQDAALAGSTRNVAEMKYQDKLNEYGKAFEKYAADTGRIPETEEGWSVLKFDPGLPGWKGPYIEGPIPPLDPWRRALVYKKVKGQSGKVFGRVYSLWQDGRDQGGENSSVDKVALIMYYNLEAFKTDGKSNPTL